MTTAVGVSARRTFSVPGTSIIFIDSQMQTAPTSRENRIFKNNFKEGTPTRVFRTTSRKLPGQDVARVLAHQAIQHVGAEALLDPGHARGDGALVLGGVDVGGGGVD